MCGGVILCNHTGKATLESFAKISQTSPVSAACAPGRSDGEGTQDQPGTKEAALCRAGG